MQQSTNTRLQNSTDMTCPIKLDICIKSTLRDLQCYKHLQQNLLRYSKLQGKVYLSVPKEHINCFKEIIDSSINLYSDEELLQGFGYNGRYNDSWHGQQIIKLLMAANITNDAALILDSNTILCKEIHESDFLMENRFIYETSRLKNTEKDFWLRQKQEYKTAHFLGLDHSTDLNIRNIIQIFRKDTVCELMNYLSNREGKNFVELIQKKIQYTYVTEFHLYGLYSHHFKPESHSFTQRNAVMQLLYKRQMKRLLKNKNSLEYIFNELTVPENLLYLKIYKTRSRYSLNDDQYDFFVRKISDFLKDRYHYFL